MELKFDYRYIIHLIKCLKKEKSAEDVERVIDQLQKRVDKCQKKIQMKEGIKGVRPSLKRIPENIESEDSEHS